MKLLQGDCLDLLPTIPDGSIDMILTSPPYAIGKDYDETISLERFIAEYSNKIKDNGVFAFQTGNRVSDGFIEPIDLITYPIFKGLGYRLINRVIWTFGHGAHCRNRLSGRHEVISIYAKSKSHTFNLDSIRVPQKHPNKKHFKGKKKGQLSCNPLGKNPSDVWAITNVKNNHPEKTSHPCQFPEELCRRLINAFSNKGDVVLDPFMGSGTTGKVAKELNRQFIGIEKDPEYFKIAQERIFGQEEVVI